MTARKHVFRVPCSVKEVDRAVDVRAARDSALMFLRTVAGAQLSQQTEKLYSDPRFFETLEAFSRDLLLAEGEPDETAFRESLAYQPGWKREQEAIRLAGQALVATILQVDWKAVECRDDDDQAPAEFSYSRPANADADGRVWAEVMIQKAGHYASLLLQPRVATAGRRPNEREEAILPGLAACTGEILHYLRVWLIHRLKPVLSSLVRDLFADEQFTKAEVEAKIAEVVDDDLRAQLKSRDWRSLAKVREDLDAQVETEAVQ
jgi:hypothetical protein